MTESTEMNGTPYDIRVITTQPQRIFGVRKEINIGQTEALFQEAKAAMALRGLEPAGPGIMFYHGGEDFSYDAMDSEAAYPVSGEHPHAEEELGDLLFAAVNVARHLEVDAEEALTRSCEKFTRRFTEAERLARERGINMPEAGIETLDILWGEVKYKETKFGGIVNDKGRTD